MVHDEGCTCSYTTRLFTVRMKKKKHFKHVSCEFDAYLCRLRDR